MKKIIRVFSVLIVLAALFSCDGKKIYVDESKSTAPVLTNGTGGASGLSADFTPGELNVNNAFATHTLAIVDLNGKAVSKVVNSKLAGNKLTATAKEVSRSLSALGIAVDSTVSFKAAVRITLNAALDYGGVDSEGTIDVEDFKVINFRDKAKPVQYYDYSYEFTEASTWSVIGSIASEKNPSSWDADLPMISNGTWHVCVGVELKATDQFKFRKDAAWGTNFGAADGITEEPYVVALGEEQPAGAGGKNLGVEEDGVYDLLLNPEAGLYRVVKHAENPFASFTTASAWSVIGSIASDNNPSSWDADLAMITDGGKWSVCVGVVLAETDQFKFRKDAAWGTNFGAADGITEEPFVVTVGEAQSAGAGGKNLGVPADGIYNLLINEEDALYLVTQVGVVPDIN